MEELARPQRLPDAVQERQPRHRLVGDLGVDADALGAVERGDEVQRVPDGRQEDVAARLVRLRLDRERHVVALLDHVLVEHVDRLAVALERVARVLGAADLGALAAAPEDVDLGAQRRAQVDRAHRLADRRAPHAAVVGGEGPVLEGRVPEQVGRAHADAAGRSPRAPPGSAPTMRSASAAGVPHGIRSLSCRLTPQAPSSASLCTESTGSSGARVGSPKGSRPGLPTVHSPKVKRGSVMRRPGAARRRGSGAGRPGRPSAPRRSSRWRCCP